MNLGVFTTLFNDWTFENTLAHLSGLGVETVEVGSGGFPGRNHLNPDELLNNPAALDHVRHLQDRYGIRICALSCHANPVHPDENVAGPARYDFEQTVRLAQALGIDTVVTFSGCPGDGTGSRYSNWVTTAWPDEFREILRYQWEEVLIPYWHRAAEFARNHGVPRIALEMHPGFCVYNPETLLRLRHAVGTIIGANFDPSHLFWQGIDPVRVIRALDGAIYHFHAKDTRIEDACQVNGVLETKQHYDLQNRSWLFRTVGYGHTEQVWKDMVSALKIVGYDRTISIEHEDPLMSSEEGLRKAILFLKQVIIAS